MPNIRKPTSPPSPYYGYTGEPRLEPGITAADYVAALRRQLEPVGDIIYARLRAADIDLWCAIDRISKPSL
jgi:hypothetical protein